MDSDDDEDMFDAARDELSDTLFDLFQAERELGGVNSTAAPQSQVVHPDQADELKKRMQRTVIDIRRVLEEYRKENLQQTADVNFDVIAFILKEVAQGTTTNIFTHIHGRPENKAAGNWHLKDSKDCANQPRPLTRVLLWALTCLHSSITAHSEPPDIPEGAWQAHWERCCDFFVDFPETPHERVVNPMMEVKGLMDLNFLTEKARRQYESLREARYNDTRDKLRAEYSRQFGVSPRTPNPQQKLNSIIYLLQG